jgi:hypothetical protein
MSQTFRVPGEPASKAKLQEMAAAWDMLAMERKLDLDERKPD